MPSIRTLSSGNAIATTARSRLAVLAIILGIAILVLVRTNKNTTNASPPLATNSPSGTAVVLDTQVAISTVPAQVAAARSPTVLARLRERLINRSQQSGDPLSVSHSQGTAASASRTSLSFQEFLSSIEIGSDGSLRWGGQPLAEWKVTPIVDILHGSLPLTRRYSDYSEGGVVTSVARSGGGGNPIRENSDGKIEGHDHQNDAGGSVLDINGATKGTLQVSKGGTGKASYSTGELLIGNGLAGLSTLMVGSNGQVLTVTDGNVTWADLPPSTATGNVITSAMHATWM